MKIILHLALPLLLSLPASTLGQITCNTTGIQSSGGDKGLRCSGSCATTPPACAVGDWKNISGTGLEYKTCECNGVSNNCCHVIGLRDGTGGIEEFAVAGGCA